jgi:hypothetical protein
MSGAIFVVFRVGLCIAFAASISSFPFTAAFLLIVLFSRSMNGTDIDMISPTFPSQLDTTLSELEYIGHRIELYHYGVVSRVRVLPLCFTL